MRGTAYQLALLFVFAVFAEELHAAETFKDCAGCPVMAVIAPASFEMGSPPSAVEGNGDEGPVHRVTFAKAFAVGIYEVTRGEFTRFVADTGYDTGNECQVVRDEHWQVVPGRSWKNPGFRQTDAEPVVCVSWLDATKYIEWLSARAGRKFRLLSESEWEYLAVTGSAGHALSPKTANYKAADAWQYTAPVGSFGPDALGLYDVLGNVWEWLQDCYFGSYEGTPADGSARTVGCTGKRSVRGGSYGDTAELLRPTYRLRGPEGGRYVTLGFRLARNLD